MNNNYITLTVALIAASGVIISVLVNLYINHINRSKSQNEWKREKLLALVSEFINAFNEESTGVNIFDGYQPDLIREMVLAGFRGGESEKLIYRICMLIDSNDADTIIELYRKMKNKISTDIENDWYSNARGNPEETLYKADDKEIINLIKHISRILKSMK
ncbi:hypothetical protein [Yersinia enterocolitica]|uniref:hypothetical protein n=1 Tax=Yersinia enterocolitica TaxID=630 RepID=UPI003D7A5F6A